MTESPLAPSLSWFGDSTLQLSFESPRDAQDAIRTAFETLRHAPEIQDLVPAYATLLIRFKNPLDIPADCKTWVRSKLTSNPSIASILSSHPPINIPICYDFDCAPDIAAVAQHANLSIADVINTHASAEYQVAFIGFSPGFPYLTGLPAHLAMPRLEKPRLRVPAGSVGIAGDQTGIYPRATPGGWRLIGRTPLNLFDPASPTPSLLAPGDRVRFTPISRADFDAALASTRRAEP